MRITLQELEVLVPQGPFERGQSYFNQGLIELRTIKPRSLTARVAGTEVPPYIVILKKKKNVLSGSCTCPAFEKTGPCKHIAAAGLALVQHHQDSYLPSDTFFIRTEFFDKLERYFAALPKRELLAFIRRLTTTHPEIMFELEEKLQL